MINREAFEQLDRVLAEVDSQKLPFSMEVWQTSGRETEHKCGTAACAAGWAARDPWFRERGFTMKLGDSAPRYMPPGTSSYNAERFACWGFEAAERFFGLYGYEVYTPSSSTSLVNWIFSGTPRASVSEVRARVAAVLAHDPTQNLLDLS